VIVFVVSVFWLLVFMASSRSAGRLFAGRGVHTGFLLGPQQGEVRKIVM
jgi:hypothetical protein